MRPHVELIHEDDYIWHGAELIGGEGRASERRLSVDEEDGSSRLGIVDLRAAWRALAVGYRAWWKEYADIGRLESGPPLASIPNA